MARVSKNHCRNIRFLWCSYLGRFTFVQSRKSSLCYGMCLVLYVFPHTLHPVILLIFNIDFAKMCAHWFCLCSVQVCGLGFHPKMNWLCIKKNFFTTFISSTHKQNVLACKSILKISYAFQLSLFNS